jgi:hypothetical protein
MSKTTLHPATIKCDMHCGKTMIYECEHSAYLCRDCGSGVACCHTNIAWFEPYGPAIRYPREWTTAELARLRVGDQNIILPDGPALREIEARRPFRPTHSGAPN